MESGDLYRDIPDPLPLELSQSILTADTSRVKIERIVSKGHRSPAGFWYDQSDNEWVLLAKGEARLRFETDDRVLHLTPGMHVTIAAHERHRVDWTSETEETIWLAVYY
jgi:cupin 2 domain-containing protein